MTTTTRKKPTKNRPRHQQQLGHLATMSVFRKARLSVPPGRRPLPAGR